MGVAPVTAVQTIDFDAVFEQITAKIKADVEERLIPPLIRIWDGDWNLRGICKQEIGAEFQFLDNETGTGMLEMPADYFLSEWLAAADERPTSNVHVTMDKDGARWGGRMSELQVIDDERGRRVRVLFKHDYEELKHILAWSNPFLPEGLQFPRLWVLFHRARSGLKTTLHVNLRRIHKSGSWVAGNPLTVSAMNAVSGISNWSQVVKPDLTPDNSVGAIVTSRFKNMHEVSRKIVADAQLSWEPRRYLNGDPPPWPGANLRHGTLVWDLIDKSGWNTGTSFGGNIFTGLVRQFTSIGTNGLDESLETVADPNVPAAYQEPGVKGTDPAMPGVIYRESEHTGIQSSMYSLKPATDRQIVAGGHSMPGVNELISSAIQMAGDLTAMIPGVPPLGGVADAVLKPLYTDVIAAFGKWENITRAQRMGWSHYHERWQEGADRAYTLAWLLAMRTGRWETREQHSVTLEVADGAPWKIGQNGFGHYFLGDRIGVSLEAPLAPGRIIVERVSELVISWSRDTTPTWRIQIGQRKHEDPVLKAFEQMQDFLGIIQELGVV